MNKTAIKNFAIWARVQLIDAVKQRAYEYEITEDGANDADFDTIGGRLLTPDEQQQRRQLLTQIRQKGYTQVMEETAYTWFNRFIALRYMEVNGYLPSRIRVFTDDSGSFKPQILQEAMTVELDGLNRNRVFRLLDEQANEELYKYLLITQCNALNASLPYMFQRIANWTELLFPANLLRDGSVLSRMVSDIPEEDWQDQVQIIGWLYQYYNTEPKDKVFANLNKNIKISKENIPAATQLFTPDWIVHYMVENSLGRLWLEGHPDARARLLPTAEEQVAYAAGNRAPEDRKWHYYLDEAEQEPEVQAKLDALRAEYANLQPEDIRVIDPCAGSGHILVVLFDTLVQIYEHCGYTPRDAASLIVAKNIFGLDIDDRAAQLSYFAVMMKARQYDRRFFSRGIQPHVYAIAESNDIDETTLRYFTRGDANLERNMRILITELHDAKEYGSILNIPMVDFPSLYARLAEIDAEISIHRENVLITIRPLIQTAETLARKYDVVCTNPPYMGSSNMNPKLNEFIKNKYADYKSDFFSAFIVRASEMTTSNGYCGFFTPYVWMFIQSYEKLRQYLYNQATIETLIQFEYSAFEEATVPVCTFAFSNSHVAGKKGNYLRLVDFRGGMEVQRQKTLEAIADHNCGYYYEQTTDNFSKIPGSPVAYWVSEKFFDTFSTGKLLGTLADSKQGLATADNNRFLRQWYEVAYKRINFVAKNTEDAKCSGYKWFPYNKGGEFRKWYGNNDCIVNWEDDGYEIRHNFDEKGKLRSRPQNTDFYFRESASWSLVTSSVAAFRYKPYGHIFDVAGMSFFSNDKLKYLLGLCNSTYATRVLEIIAPTINYQCGDIANIPVILRNKHMDDVTNNVTINISISRFDWDSYETSWDFKRHPMLNRGKLADAYAAWKTDCESRFLQLKANEEELNRIFIDIYGLQDELTPDVADKDVTVHRTFDTKDDVPESMKGSNYVRTMRDEVVSLISYAVGCMFGRYSLDVDGLAYAGGEWDGSKYQTFMPDKDNIIPICDDDYFDDDITGRFIKWVEAVYGADTLEENLKFIASALGGKGSAREVIRNYFISDFYADHLKTYQKRPIYWLFDSGKKGGFKALIYMHRYQPDTIARIRTDYVHEQQSRYRTAIADLQQRITGASTGDRVKLTKQLTKLEAQAEEIRTYEEKIHHLADQMIPIDLDDGVKVNYAKLADVLTKLK